MIPVLAAIVAIAASWHGCAVFKVRGRRVPGLGTRSLKTQQHAPTGDDSKAVAESLTSRLGKEPYGRQVRSTYLEPSRARATRYAPLA